MFTGIVRDVGHVAAREARAGGDLRLVIAVATLELAAVALGDSIAVAGVCLTVVACDARTFTADVSRETLALTTLGQWRVGQRVNLEPALHLGDALGGHLVAGHVDGTAEIRALEDDAHSRRLRIAIPHTLTRYVARKGSVSLDGVSLTVNRAQADEFEVNLVPHTLAVTTLGELAVGARCNLEVDLIARYAERLLNTHD